MIISKLLQAMQIGLNVVIAMVLVTGVIGFISVFIVSLLKKKHQNK